MQSPGYTPFDVERAQYAWEAFCLSVTVEEQKLIEEDPHGALNLLVYYQHHGGVIAGALRDKYEKYALQLEAPSPVVPQSSAAIIERDFFRDQMLIRNRLTNLRLEEIQGCRREISNVKGAMQKQHAALLKKEAELEKALARVAEVEKELAECDFELGKLKENVKQQEEELSSQTIKKFLSSVAFTEAARIPCTNLTKASIYKELKKLSAIYPFDPEHCGFVKIPKKDRYAAVLPGFFWDIAGDRLRNARGKKVKPPTSFESIEPEMISIPWKGTFNWPRDVNNPAAGWIDIEEQEKG